MQQNKNLIIAIVLCLGIMFGWGYLAEYMGWVKRPDPVIAAKQEAEQRHAQLLVEQQAKEAAENKAKIAILPVFAPSDGREVTIDTPLYSAKVYSGGGILRSYTLNKYRHGLEMSSPNINLVDPPTAAMAPWGLLVNGQPSWSTGKWSFEGTDLKLEEGTQGVLRFTGEVDGLRIVRDFQFRADTYLMTEKLRIMPIGDQPRSVRLGFTVASDASAATGGQYDAMRVAWDLAGKFKEDSDIKDLTSTGVQEKGQIFWATTMSTYFMNAVALADTTDLTLKGRLQNDIYRAALERPDLIVPPNTETEMEISYWVGPKLRSLLVQAPNNLVNTIDLGMFSIIAKALLWLLEFFYGYVHNWGLAIILLTVLIKAVFWPLTAKSYASMEKMKKLQPMMVALREKYADNKEQMNKEVMGLYKTYGVNPASGCVPILVQLPVFFGLYQALLTSIELRHAAFITYLPGTDMLWLADLSAKDPYYITPIIMGVTMFLQQKMSPPAGDPMQQKIMMFLPLIFTAMFLSFPSGLVLYWLVNNVLSIAQQWMMMRKLKAD